MRPYIKEKEEDKPKIDEQVHALQAGLLRNPGSCDWSTHYT